MHSAWFPILFFFLHEACSGPVNLLAYTREDAMNLDGSSLPHPSCLYFKAALWCGPGLNFPENFDMRKIRNDTSQIFFRRGSVNAGFQPLPRLPQLRLLEITDFNTNPGGDRFPLNEFLQNNKDLIEELSITRIPLNRLVRRDLEGFNALRLFRCAACGLTQLGSNLLASMASSGIPVLEGLQIVDSPNLRRFDWGILKPVADSLEKLTIVDCGLTEIYLNSTAFTLPKLKRELDLSFNTELKTIPQFVLDSLPQDLSGFPRKLDLGLRLVKLCDGSEKCDCCDAAPLINWVLANTPKVEVQGLQCGKDAFQIQTTTPIMGC